MLNYINSELFRISRNKKLYILVGVVAALIIMMGVVLAGFGKDSDFPYATTAFSLGNEYRSMNYLLLILLILAMYLDDNEYKQHTMKHSVAYGIGRHTIYIARFVAQIIVSAVIYMVMNILLTKHKNTRTRESPRLEEVRESRRFPMYGKKLASRSPSTMSIRQKSKIRV